MVGVGDGRGRWVRGLRCRGCGAHGAHLAADDRLFSVFLVLLPENFVQRHINIPKPLHGKATPPPYGGETLYPPSVERSSCLKRLVSSCQFKVQPLSMRAQWLSSSIVSTWQGRHGRPNIHSTVAILCVPSPRHVPKVRPERVRVVC